MPPARNEMRSMKDTIQSIYIFHLRFHSVSSRSDKLIIYIVKNKRRFLGIAAMLSWKKNIYLFVIYYIKICILKTYVSGVTLAFVRGSEEVQYPQGMRY